MTAIDRTRGVDFVSVIMMIWERTTPTSEMLGADESSSMEAPGLKGRRVLLIEDEPALLGVFSAMLEAFGCVVWRATNAEQARAIAAREGDRIDLLFTDILLGRGENGLDLVRALQLDRPGLPVLFTSGYVGPHTCEALGLVSGENFLSKPFRVEDLKVTLTRILRVPVAKDE